MIIGTRIEQLMLEQGLTQAELARRVGVAQPTIYKLIRGNKSGSKHLHQVARELGTSPEFFTGETDDRSIAAPIIRFSSDEIEWVDLLRAIAPEDRKAILRIARTIATSSQSPLLQSQQQQFRGE